MRDIQFRQVFPVAMVCRQALVLATVLFLLVPVGSAENLTFTGTCDKNPLLYQAGEEMVFTVTLVDKDRQNEPVNGRRLKWKRNGDDGKQSEGEAISDEPLVVKTSIDRPGFVRITVNVLDADGKELKGRTEKYDGGAGADVNHIPAYPPPADFDDFWDAEVQKLGDTPYKVNLTEVVSKVEGISVGKFEITTFEGERPSTGFIAFPKDAEEKSLPLTVYVTGYGFGATNVPYDAAKKGGMGLAITRHGEEPDRDAAYYETLRQNEMKSFCFRHNDDKYQNDFYKMIMRDLRAVQYAKSRPEWDGKNLSTTGGSMGGFQSIAIAALEPAASQCNAYIPWVADLAGVSKFERMGGWRPAFTEILGYFDTANLARRVTCPVTMAIGLGDYVCPPSGEIILFNNLGGEKVLTVNQNMGHGSLLGVNTAKYVFEQAIK